MVPQRSFDGYAYEQRLAVGFYGEVFKARSASEQNVCLLHVAGELATQPGFAEALAHHGGQLELLDHRNTVSTRKMGRAVDGTLVVVTSAVEGISLSDLIATHPHGLSPHIACAVAAEVARGLGGAHDLGIVHGGVHPRSIFIAPDGTVKVTDFAVARAAAASGQPASGSHRFLAPELSLGDAPSRKSDVFAAGALLAYMLTGDAPAKDIDDKLFGCIEPAVTSDLNERLPDGKALYDAILSAIRDCDFPGVSAAELAALATGVPTRQGNVDNGEGSAIREANNRQRVRVPLPANVSDSAAGLPTAIADELEPDALDEMLAELSDPAAKIPTVVREPVGNTHSSLETGSPRGNSDFLAHPTPLPPISPPHTTGADEEEAFNALEIQQAQLSPPLASAPVFKSDTQAARAWSLTEEAPTNKLAPVAGLHGNSNAQPPVVSLSESAIPTSGTVTVDVDPLSLDQRGNHTLLWSVVTVGVLLGTFVLLYTKTNLFHPERERAENQRRDRQRAAAEARLKALQPKLGTIVVTANEDGAAVWVLLGRTPVDSMRLRTSVLHEVRLQHDGYTPLDLRVTATHWSGDAAAMQAVLTGTLVPGNNIAKAAPPQPPSSAAQGLPNGRGVIRLHSTPPGAQAWLLVGFVPDVSLRFEAGKEYEFKVLKDGFHPGFAVVRESDWKGAAGQLRREVKLNAELKEKKTR